MLCWILWFSVAWHCFPFLTQGNCNGCSAGGSTGQCTSSENKCMNFVNDKVYGCCGTWSVAGMFGTGSNSAGAICGSGYEVCPSASRAKALGLEYSTCSSAYTDQFFASQQSGSGSLQCNSAGSDDVFGCTQGGSVTTIASGDCNSTFYGVISTTSVSWAGGAWSFSGSDGTDEVDFVTLSDKLYGGVLCCKEKTNAPTPRPTSEPSNPTLSPTMIPSKIPTNNPSIDPTFNPTSMPTKIPSNNPSSVPFDNPTIQPSGATNDPTKVPSTDPSMMPSMIPSVMPSSMPSTMPSVPPTTDPTSSGTDVICIQLNSQNMTFNDTMISCIKDFTNDYINANLESSFKNISWWITSAKLNSQANIISICILISSTYDDDTINNFDETIDTIIDSDDFEQEIANAVDACNDQFEVVITIVNDDGITDTNDNKDDNDSIFDLSNEIFYVIVSAGFIIILLICILTIFCFYKKRKHRQAKDTGILKYLPDIVPPMVQIGQASHEVNDINENNNNNNNVTKGGPNNNQMNKQQNSKTDRTDNVNIEMTGAISKTKTGERNSLIQAEKVAVKMAIQVSGTNDGNTNDGNNSNNESGEPYDLDNEIAQKEAELNALKQQRDIQVQAGKTGNTGNTNNNIDSDNVLLDESSDNNDNENDSAEEMYNSKNVELKDRLSTKGGSIDSRITGHGNENENDGDNNNDDDDNNNTRMPYHTPETPYQEEGINDDKLEKQSVNDGNRKSMSNTKTKRTKSRRTTRSATAGGDVTPNGNGNGNRNETNSKHQTPNGIDEL